MANGVSGDIKLGVDLETKSAAQSLQSLRKKVYQFLGGVDAEGIKKQIKDTNKEINQQEKNIERVKKKLDELNSSSEPPKSVIAMEKELQKLEKDLKDADAQFEKLSAEQTDLASRKVDGLTMEQSLGPEQYSRFQELDSLITQNGEHTAQLQKEISRLQAKISKLKANPNLTEEGKKYNKELKQATINLEKQKAKLAELEKQHDSTTKASTRLGKSTNDFAKRIGSLVKSALIFSVITKALTVLRQAFGKALMQNEQFASSVAQIKGNLLTAFMPIYQIVLPALQALMNMLAKVTAYIAKFVSLLTGKSVDASKKAAKALYEQAGAASEAGKATEEAQKSTLAFDELNTVSSGGDSSAASGGAGNSESAPDFSFDVSSIKETLMGLEAFVGGALAAIGVILLFSGHVVIGAGLLAAGLMSMAISAKEGFKANEIKQTLEDLSIFIGTMALVFGVILLFYGQIAAGLGCLAVGAISIASAIAANWGEPQEIRETLNSLLSYISGVTLVLGVIVLISGVNIPLGIALIAVGAVALASAVALNWETISNFLTEHLEVIRVILGGALLVIGAILAISGVNLPLGIGLLAVGAIALGNAAVIAWDKLSEETKTKIKAITAIVSAATLVIGILLVLTGVNIPLGIGLIAAGAVGLISAVALSWDTIKTKIKDFLNGIITLFETGVNKIIGLLNKISFDLPDILGGAHIGFNISPISIPRLAQGAVIPANREFLAVLGDQKHGTNIEAPLSTIEDAVENVLNKRGYTDNKNININFTGNLAQLARVLKPQLDNESRRKGTKLVIGGAH